jgi:lipoprotein NlpD
VAVHAALYLACAMLATSCAMTDDWFGGPSASTQLRAPGPAAGIQPGFYRVNVGDTIPSVAAGFGQTPQNIADWNRLPPNAMLTPGQVLRVVPPATPGVKVPGGPVIPLAWPAYGQVLKPVGAGGSKGITIAGQADQPVKAAADGQVIYVGSASEPYTSLIIVKHGEFVTGYSVNGPVDVKEGDTVTKGQKIATMGTNNGRSTLQFEIRRGGTPLDPLAHLPR